MRERSAVFLHFFSPRFEATCTHRHTVVPRPSRNESAYYLFRTNHITALHVVHSPGDQNPEPPLSAYQQEVVSYFKDIALGFEYGNAPAVTRKWKKDMRVFVTGESTPESTSELNLVIGELNSLFSDGFKIELVERREESNFVIFFGSRADFTALYPADAKTVAHSSGLFHIFWNTSNEITRGYLFIHTHNTSQAEQRHTIREELTQALGLGKDSPRYRESIFQASWTIPTAFAPIDRELIRLLYHPQMEAGADAAGAEELLTRILASELVATNVN